MSDFIFDRDNLAALSKYYAELTGENEAALIDKVMFDIEVGEDSDPHGQLTNGLTTLYRACWDLTDLFRIAARAKGRTKKLELLILGILFETRNKLDVWVSAQIRNYYDLKGKDPSAVLAVGKEVCSLFEKHRPGLKLVRDRIFHVHPWHSDEIVFRVAEVMYQRRIPGLLHKSLVDYGIRTVEQLCKEGIGIPGIACFGVVCIDGRDVPNNTYQHLAHEYWP